MPQMKAMLGNGRVETAKAQAGLLAPKDAKHEHDIVEDETCPVVTYASGSEQTCYQGSAQKVLDRAEDGLAALRVDLGLSS